MKKVALSIAGSDPSGGAGIQTDIKTFSFLGVHGTSVVTCITSQNTQRVKNIYKLPVEIIENQIDTLLEDFKIDAVKTGMLFDNEIIESVAKKISKFKLKPIVDPVMVSTSGDLLSKNDDFVDSFKELLLPKALIVTANIPEAIEFTGLNIKSSEDFEKACKVISKLGPKYVLIKGGHLKDEKVLDVLYDGKKFYNFSLPRIKNKKAHGSGCNLSALITGFIALKETPIDAVRKAKFVLWDMINKGYIPGKGSDVLNHESSIKITPTCKNYNYYDVWFDLKNSIEKLLTILPQEFVPEVGMNFAFALKNAKKLKDICAIDGRIIKSKNMLQTCGNIDFGVSKHVASIVLAAMSFDLKYRSALNIKFSENNLKLCKNSGLKISNFRRKNEPKSVGSTMEWGTKKASENINSIPDIIYDTGDIGKEPMIRVLGENPNDVISKLTKIIKYKI